MAEASLYDCALAALALIQSRGDLIEAIFLAARLSHHAATLRLRRGQSRPARMKRRAPRLGNVTRTFPADSCSALPSTIPTACSIRRSLEDETVDMGERRDDSVSEHGHAGLGPPRSAKA
jgi:alpha-D-ribose 1-methylphosphonate 5-triphosphate synthase subunit PhnI